MSNIVRVMLGDRIAQHMRVFAGDMVPKKKPAPDIYLLAAKVRTARWHPTVRILRWRVWACPAGLQQGPTHSFCPSRARFLLTFLLP